MGQEEEKEMTEYKNIKLDLKSNPEELYRHPEDRSIKFDKMFSIFNHIDKQFRSSFPWMYIFLTYKNNGKKVLFQCLRSIPIIAMSEVYSNERSITLRADWTGDNVDNFFAKKKDKKPKENQKPKKVKWEAVRDDSLMTKKKAKLKEKAQFIMIDGQPPEKYISQLRMAINDISAVYVYNSGFEVQTDSPIDLACIKRSSILKFIDQKSGNFQELMEATNNSIALEQGIVKGILEKEHFVLPSEVIHIKKLRAFWNKKEQQRKNKEVDAWLLGKPGAEPEINPGQEVNQNILF
jgi:hypothetical protein